ncbi:NUDIX domain-containing protein [Salinicoccus hispanicus]|uniref:NUDIX domain-containing protein n=1 Tax=Salinicoccus hispanicus TaxID=157225 RepID=A0A6N8U1R1_9STAP|nr:NUDIX domain-containing protein [Salinicoccus hispanicus]MXQ52030.1 NUDIX domain-containing protein [Salinicoccus hispanicus]
MMRNRSAVVIVEGGSKVALIKRIRDGSVYYVFPGGGIEGGETPEEAARREAFEELGLKVKVGECIAEVDFDGTHYFFLAKTISGTFGSGQGEEYIDSERDRGKYIPMWVDMDRLSSIDVRPKAVAVKVQDLFSQDMQF